MKAEVVHSLQAAEEFRFSNESDHNQIKIGLYSLFEVAMVEAVEFYDQYSYDHKTPEKWMNEQAMNDRTNRRMNEQTNGRTHKQVNEKEQTWLSKWINDFSIRKQTTEVGN